jgi:threonine dehydrogenase-like Zn-dependent dehydrogenase
MRATLIHAPGDIRVEDVPIPELELPTDAVLKVTAVCVCGSDLWNYRGINEVKRARQIGHEYVGVIESLGSSVAELNPDLAVGDFVVGSFCTSENTCEICRAGFQSVCPDGHGVGKAQAQFVRIPDAAGTLVKVPGGRPDDEKLLSLLAASDVFGTGWFAADSAGAAPGKTIAVVGDGAVGLLGVLSAKTMGAERIIVFSRHPDRQALAREFGATDIVETRGDEGAAAVKELTGGYGAHGVIEAVGTQEAMMQAIHSARPGGRVGFVGVSHDVNIPGEMLFRTGVQVSGGVAPVRRYLPELIDLILAGSVNPGRVFTRTRPLEEAAAAYADMDQRREIKVALIP